MTALTLNVIAREAMRLLFHAVRDVHPGDAREFHRHFAGQLPRDDFHLSLKEFSDRHLWAGIRQMASVVDTRRERPVELQASWNGGVLRIDVWTPGKRPERIEATGKSEIVQYEIGGQNG